jgi:GT2 family glycosyltransferase
MDLSVLIVTFNSRDHIAACLRSLEAPLTGLAHEVLVIDNASSDGTVDVVRSASPGARIVELPENRGFAAGVNAGLAASSGEFVLWLNPDSRYVSGSPGDVIDWMRAHADVGIVGGRILDPDGSVQRSARVFPSYGAVLGARYSLLTKLFPKNPFSTRYLRTHSDYDQIEPVDWVSGACLMHTRATSDALRGADDGFFMYFEDVDFCYRAWQAGRKVFFHPGMTVEHEIGGSSTRTPAALLVIRHRSLWRWYAKHFKRFWLKDAVVWVGVWVRCAALIAAGAGRRRSNA